MVADVATPETDRQLCCQAKERSVRELADIARAAGEMQRASSPAGSRSDHDRRYLRFNDGRRTISARLAPESYVETRPGCTPLEEIPSDARHTWDQRRADAFMELIRSAGGE